MENKNIPENRNTQQQAQPRAPRPNAAPRPANAAPRPQASAQQQIQSGTAANPQSRTASPQTGNAQGARPVQNSQSRAAANAQTVQSATNAQIRVQAGSRPAQAQSHGNVPVSSATPPAKAMPPQRQPAAASHKAPVTGQPVSAAQAPTAEKGTQSTANIPHKEKQKKKTTLSKAGAEMMSSAVKAIIYMVAVFVVAIFLSIIIIRVGNDVFALVKSDEVIDVTIPENATLSDVGDILHENSIISFPGLFTMYGNLKHDDGVFIAGNYSVSPSMSYDDLRDAFKPQPVTGTSWITIPEGYTVDEIISLMVSYGIGEREEYIDVINNYDFDYWFIDEIPENPDRHYRLEGYLFPDTYEFYNSSSEVTVINKLLARFEEVFVKDYRDKAADLGMSVDEIITIASLIEKEAGTAADYRYVSSVFHNRLNNSSRFPKLESDATTVYAMQLDNNGVRPEDVSADDIRNYDSPYNSYKNSGLIPGAIANPSASAIRYALYPTESNYYFFVAGPGGTTYFASTQGEHDANIAKVKALMTQSED